MTDPTAPNELLPTQIVEMLEHLGWEATPELIQLVKLIESLMVVRLRRTPAPPPPEPQRDVREVQIRQALDDWCHAAGWDHLRERVPTLEWIARMKSAHCDERSEADLRASGGLPENGAIAAIRAEHDCGCEVCSTISKVCPASASSYAEEILRLRMALGERTAREARLREALRQYGHHARTCQRPLGPDCTCGWNRARAALADTKEPSNADAV